MTIEKFYISVFGFESTHWYNIGRVLFIMWRKIFNCGVLMFGSDVSSSMCYGKHGLNKDLFDETIIFSQDRI